MSDSGKIASIKARLRNLARVSGGDYSRFELLYFQERLLARLANSKYHKHFVLKGGLYLYSLYGAIARPTRDIDFLGQDLASEESELLKTFQEIVSIDLDDGIYFDADNVQVEAITAEAKYQGTRLKIPAYLNKSTQRLQCDIGFGDIVTPAPEALDFPTLLNETSFPMYAYSKETVIAEKLQAMTSLYMVNTRLKDFYDLYQFAQEATTNQVVLKKAIEETFKHRETPISDIQRLFEPEFLENEDKSEQWQAYWSKQHQSSAPSFSEVMIAIKKLIGF